MKTKKLEKFQQDIAGLTIEELQAKRKQIIKRDKTFFLWGVHGTWIAGLFLVPLVLFIHNLGYEISVWSFILLYLACYFPFSFLVARGLRTSETWLISKRLHELGSEPDVIN
jgi:ABC-type glycerol-3-phosphate transport system permease component